MPPLPRRPPPPRPGRSAGPAARTLLVLAVGLGTAGGRGFLHAQVPTAAPFPAPPPGDASAPATGEGHPDAPSPGDPLTPSAVANPFADFRTHVLGNGLRVWYRRLPGAPNVSVSVAVPFGWDHDPEGKEETAHFLEHVLFSDHDGRTEQEIKDEIDLRGGRRNGYTTPDHTFYWVTIGKEHGLFALRWLARIVEPRELDPAVVARNREPVAIEVRASPRQLTDWAEALLNPGWLRRPDFWAREFGLATREARTWDRWRSLASITAADLQAFYERYYAPGGMTLTVVGDLDPDSVLTLAEATFGRLAPRELPAAYAQPVDPGRGRRNVTWTFRSDVSLQDLYKVYAPDGETRLELLFMAYLLDRRLSARLRHGERKAVYDIGAWVRTRGPAVFLSIEGRIEREDYDFAREVIEEELAALRSGSGLAARFEADRASVVEQLQAQHRAPQELAQWVHTAFYDPAVFPDFPDVATFFAGLEQDEVAASARAHLVPERRVTWVRRPQPLTEGGALALGVLLALVVVRLAGAVLTRPVRMREIRYVARLRMPVPVSLLVHGTLALVAVAVGRLLVRLGEAVALEYVAPVEHYGVQMAAYGAMGAGALALALALVARIPRKVLVFRDHVRIKGLAYRSRVIRPEDVTSLALLRFPALLRSGRLLRTVPLAAGLAAPALYLEVRRGPSWFFRVREPEELLEVMQEVLGRSPGVVGDGPGRTLGTATGAGGDHEPVVFAPSGSPGAGDAAP